MACDEQRNPSVGEEDYLAFLEELIDKYTINYIANSAGEYLPRSFEPSR